MTINGRTLIGGVFLLIGFGVETSLSQVNCRNYTLVQLSGAIPIGGSTTNNVTKPDCESSCLSDTSCQGFTWLADSCTLNRQAEDALYYNVSTGTDYYSLIRSYSDCSAARNCSYLWASVKNSHASGGNKNNASTLNDCIKSCQDSGSCGAVDWNTADKSCWIHANSANTLYESNNIYYFSKSCSTPTTLPFTTTTTIPVPTTSSTTTTKSTVPVPSATLPGTQGTSSTTTTPITTSTSTTSTSTSLSIASKPSSSSSSSSSLPSSFSFSSSFSSSAFSAPSTISTTASPCSGVNCGNGRKCVVHENGSTPTDCVCDTACLGVDYSPVCGTNGISYDNECQLKAAACKDNTTVTTARYGRCHQELPPPPPPPPPPPAESASDSVGGRLAIRPAYIVLAGLGGGCLLLVLTAVVILCQYPLNGAETYSSSGTLVNGQNRYQDIHLETGGGGEGGVGGGENVEFNPYYNRSELGAPDFTKEENIM